MTSIEVVLRCLGEFLAVVSAGAAVWASTRDPARLRELAARHEAALARDLGFLRWSVDARSVTSIQVAAAVIAVGAAYLARTPVPLLALVPTVAGPRLAASRARAVRVQRLEAQLDAWLTALANALVATASLGDAIASTVPLIEAPLREEIEAVLGQVKLGTPLDRALGSFSNRARSRVVEGAILALRVARNTGGNLRPTLEGAAATLREMARLEGVVRAKTAEGRAQALVVSLVPAPLVASLHFIAPQFLAPLSQSAAGWLVAFAAGALWIGAIALAVKITEVDV